MFLVTICSAMIIGFFMYTTVTFSGSNTDGSFTTAVSNSFLGPLKNKTHSCRFGITWDDFLFNIEKWNINEAILMRTHNIPSC